MWHVSVSFGFMENPDLKAALVWAKEHGCSLDLGNALVFASRDEVVRSKTRPRLSAWRRSLFAVMYRNAVRTPDRFDLPAGSFIESSRQMEL
jgi:KUP system potassium uptake protein